MKAIKVSIQDVNTLVLQEKAEKGDFIDLKSIHEVDIDRTTIEKVVKSIENDEFNSRLQKSKQDIEEKKQLEAQVREKEIISRAELALAKKDQEIASLNSKIESIKETTEAESKLSSLEEKQKIEDGYRQKLNEKDVQISEIKHKKELEEEKLKEQIKSREEALITFKEMRTRMSTKMIGESLELHCENEFNRIRSLAFPHAEFQKDNRVSETRSKGDYIYREKDEQGEVILSIMFEMKNEDESTTVKHKNKDFFKELDKDRREKGCEFAVLVSLLEKDNELYDDIVTVHDYQNMYSIRPQHFITMIGFLRQGSLKSQELRRTIQLLKNQNIDVSNFESNMNAFKEAFARNYGLASDQFAKAIEEIDKTIDHLNKVKDYLLKSDNNLRLANNKASELSIKRLTANSPTVARAFEERANTEPDTA